MAENQIDIVITADDKASRTITGIANALSSITGTITDLTSKYVAYGDQVKSLSLFTGMASEETSRLIQVADDAFVSFETLRMSARLLADKGIAPTTENLAKLSDAYLKLEPGVQRSQFLLDNFGRAGMEMGKIMELSGEKIRNMSASVENGLIIDEKKLASITASKQALDGFNDSIDAMKYEVAGQLLKIFQDLPKPIQDTALAIGALNEAGALQDVAALFITLQSMNGLFPKIIPALATFTKGIWAFVAAQTAAIAPWVLMAGAIVLAGYALSNFIFWCDNLITRFNRMRDAGIQVRDILKQINMWTVGRAAWDVIIGKLGGGRASGGPVMGGQSYIVGERGPELFTPSSSGNITPNNQLGGSTIILNYQPMVSLADRFELETKLAPIIRNAMRGAA
jgi:hypothetical protein